MNLDDCTRRLKAQGYRMTPQRLAVLQILAESEGHISPSEIYQRVAQRLPGITEATIYRTLEFLSREGLVLIANYGNGHLAYEEAGHSHHHLVCRTCGYAIEIPDTLLRSLYAQFQESTGFRIDSSHMVFLGQCPVCQKIND